VIVTVKENQAFPVLFTQQVINSPRVICLIGINNYAINDVNTLVTGADVVVYEKFGHTTRLSLHMRTLTSLSAQKGYFTCNLGRA
jgi:hypothetical protein